MKLFEVLEILSFRKGSFKVVLPKGELKVINGAIRERERVLSIISDNLYYDGEIEVIPAAEPDGSDGAVCVPLEQVLLEAVALLDEKETQGGLRMKALEELLERTVEATPGMIGLGVFDRDGLMIASRMKVPNYDQDAASGAHAMVWEVFKGFVNSLPGQLGGKLRSVVLELGVGYFEILVLGEEEYGLMGAVVRDAGLGLLKTTLRSLAPRVYNILKEV